MKTRKKFFTLAIAVLLLFALTACGGEDASSQADVSDTTSDDAQSVDADSSDLAGEEEDSDSADSSVGPSEEDAADSEEDSDLAVEEEVSDESAGWPVGIANVTPLGQPATAGFSEENVTITVEEILRGDDAFARIQQAMEGSMFEPGLPEDDTDEYLIAKISYTLNSCEGADSRNPSVSIYATDATGARYPSLLAAMFYNEPEEGDFVAINEQTAAVGETVTGYEIFLVKKDDLQPMMTYDSFYEDYSDGLWFELF